MHTIKRELKFIEKLEALKSPYPFIVRPRRFGKTLFTRLLEAYYDQAAAPRFEDDFRDTYIYDHRTPCQGQYFVLHLDFSGLDENEIIPQFNTALWMGFKDTRRRAPRNFLPICCSRPTECRLDSGCVFLRRSLIGYRENSSSSLMSTTSSRTNFSQKDTDQFRRVTGTGGFLKNFYMQIKKATDSSIASRVFITAVTVVSLDSLTSGFSIANDITRHPDFADLYGFTETELRELKYLKPAALQGLTPIEQKTKLAETLAQAKKQLERYAAADNLRVVPNLMKTAAVFVGTTLAVVEDI